MKKILLLICCIIVTIAVKAQAPVLQWVKQMGGTSGGVGNSIVLDGSSNAFTTGTFSGMADFDPGAGTYSLTAVDTSGDLFVSKLDVSGNFVWAKSMSGTGTSHAEGYSIALDAAGNIYLTGYFGGTIDFDPGAGVTNLTSTGGNDIFILKLDSSGNYIWAKDMGGASDDYGASIVIDGSGNIYTTGSFTGTADFNPGAGIFNLMSAGGNDIFISKLDVSGNFVWVKSMGGTMDDYGSAVTVDASGNVYTTGSFEGTADFNPSPATFDLTCTSSDDAFISKLDASGTFIWAKSMDGGHSQGSSIAVDASQNVYTTGSYYDMVDFDPGVGIFNLSGANMFISKLDVSGNFVWAKDMGEGADAQGCSIVLDALGNVYTTGYFEGTGDFDPGAGTFDLTYLSAIGFEMFISKLDASGNFVWAVDMDGVSFGYSIAVDASDNVYTTGFFGGTTDFNPGTGVVNLSSTNGSIFVHKMGQAPMGIYEYADNDNVSIYPNPNNGAFNVLISSPIKSASIEIYNAIGALVYKQNIMNEQSIINLTNEANGIYFVKVESENKIVASQKIIKQN